MLRLATEVCYEDVNTARLNGSESTSKRRDDENQVSRSFFAPVRFYQEGSELEDF